MFLVSGNAENRQRKSMTLSNEIREPVIERDQGQCGNCGTLVGDGGDVHHIVPRGKGGSDKLSNLRLLCRQCHDAIHEDDVMAPTVQFSSTGYMSDGSFSTFLEFIKQIPSARFDGEEKVWRVPKADCERLEITAKRRNADNSAGVSGGNISDDQTTLGD